jgi:hypothetical protein
MEETLVEKVAQPNVSEADPMMEKGRVEASALTDARQLK